MEAGPVELIGTRAKLVPMDETHIEDLFQAGQQPEIWDYMPMRINTIEDMKRLVDSALTHRDEGTNLPFVIIDQVSHAVVGSTRFLDISAANRNLEIGWTWLSPVVWRTRINKVSCDAIGSCMMAMSETLFTLVYWMKNGQP